MRGRAPDLRRSGRFYAKFNGRPERISSIFREDGLGYTNKDKKIVKIYLRELSDYDSLRAHSRL